MKYISPGVYEPDDRYLHEVNYSTPVLDYIYMNWGWGGLYDDIAFAPTGTWYVGGAAFSEGKKMIFNFALLQQ